MVWLLVGLALGGKKPAPAAAAVDFTHPTALAGPGPAPGMLLVYVLPGARTCDALPTFPLVGNGEPVILAGFNPAKVGGSAEGMSFRGPTSMGALTGSATLGEIPAGPGPGGKITFDAEGSGVSLKATLDFVLCSPLAAAPDLDAAAFAPVDVDLQTIRVHVDLPAGWTPDPGGAWIGPDTTSRFLVAAEPRRTDLVADCADAAKKQVAGSGLSGEIASARAVGTTSYVLRWTYAMGGPRRAEVRVWRQEPDWPSAVLCSLSTDARHPALLDRAELACLALTARAP